MATIVHFDIGTDNLERAKKFYEALFGWKIKVIEGFKDYYEIETADLNGVKSIGGGLTKRQEQQQTGITNFIGVELLDEFVSRVNSLGGKVQSKHVIPGYGYIAMCIDTENNQFGLFQDDKEAK